MLYLNLKSVLEARQIEKPHSFLVRIGINPHTAHKILNNDTHVMRLDNLTLICKALYCQPNDLLLFKEDPNHPIEKNHPLSKLIPTIEDNNWQKKLKTMPLDKLKQFSKMLDASENPE
jgi:DNA-binding Xre family transcriptional regulator